MAKAFIGKKWKNLSMAVLLSLGLAAVSVVSFGTSQALAADYGGPSHEVAIGTLDEKVYDEEGNVSYISTVLDSYTEADLADQGELTDLSNGYLYRKPNGVWNVVGAHDFISLQRLIALSDAGDDWGEGASLVFRCSDGDYDKYSPTWEEVQRSTLFYGMTERTLPLATDASDAPCGVAFSYLQKEIAAGETAQQTLDGAAASEWVNSTRFCIGLDEDALMVTGGDANMGKRMPTNVTEIIIVPAE